ncbi:MAG: cytochrome P450 [Hyphomicrobiales bacterium]|nr:cytochrome P450 [Hyphomicrobiales bacterium]
MSAVALDNPHPLATPFIAEPPLSALRHIPGTEGWPLVGSTLQLLADPKGEVERQYAQFGPVYRSRAFGGRSVALLGPEANEFVLFDQARTFSSTHGWGLILDRLFPRGLMLLDFDEHRLHRRALSVAFKAGPMQSYLASLNAGIAEGVAGWREKGEDIVFYPAIKQLTLDLAAVSFLGTGVGPDVAAVKRAFIDMVAAAVAVVRLPLPGTQMARGVAGRAFMIDYFGNQIEARRASDGQDIFTQLCKATTDDGALLTRQEIIDHMSFLMMAAHDTLTSSLTSFVYFLSVDRDWQQKIRDEIFALGLEKGEPLPYEKLDSLPLTEMAFKESMRLIPPVPSLPRCAMRDTQFMGFNLPAGTRVSVNPLFTHRMPSIWIDPDRFDPTRFSDDASRNRHRFAFVPFGGGAHMCLGLNFAYMQAKCFAYHLFSTTDVSARPNYAPDWKLWPIPQPRDGLRVKFKPIA